MIEEGFKCIGHPIYYAMEGCCENTPPGCCDMRGLLSFSILWLLTKREMYGQEIAEELGRRRGSTPNPGTMRGRRKVYSLTEQGRQGAIRACEYFCRAYGEIFEEYGPQETHPVQG